MPHRSAVRQSFAAAAVFAALAITVPAQRLPSGVTPAHYAIHLTPDFSTDTFGGKVGIAVRVPTPSRSITLNAAEIQFHHATITAGGRVQEAAISLDADRETATLTVPRDVPAGAATIDIRFTGQLNDKLRGFYLSRANNREYAITQLEPTDARRMFPSFDEPALKATFAISATIDRGDTAISNGRLVSDTPGPGEGRHTLTFATTKRMSTYLVALLVGDWQCVAAVADRIPVRVCGTPDRKDELAFALESTTFALSYFNRYFSIDYPFEKLDIIAVPDFSAGAMENTGAIVFREQFLLVGRDGGTTDQRKQVAQYIAHEIAHQWFGDLVTMQWWDDIWLNEGFATWMERRPLDEWKPEWDAKLDEVRDTQGAMNLDTLRATRPIHTRVETPDEIGQVFDAIAYQKTAAVIRMIEGYVGPAAYRDSINAYVKRFAYGNATGPGFWSTIASVTKKPVDAILSGYINQSSMPLVDVGVSCSGNTTQLALAQQPISRDVPASTTWQIPVCYKRTRNGAPDSACSVLAAPKTTIRLEGCSPWVFANVEGRGYYRTSYGSDGLRALGDAVRSDHLTQVEQTSLLEDVWSLVRLGEEDIADYLSLASGFLTRPPSPAMMSVLNRIHYVADHLIDPSVRPHFERWVQAQLRGAAGQLGWAPRPGDSESTKSIRAAVLSTLGYAGRDAETLREARRLVDAYFQSGTALDPSIAETALELAAINGDPALYEQYFSRMAVTARRDDEAVYRRALTHFADPALARRTMEYATSSEVRSQNAPYILGQLMARPWSAATTWAHVKNNWASLEKSLDIFQGLPAVVGAPQHFCDLAARADVEQFFTQNRVRGTERTILQSLETIDRCIATRKGQSASLERFLRAQTP